jgi:3-deoxy-D-manno-octulosonic-acid transferase
VKLRPEFPRVSLVIAPRHVRRAPAIVRLARAAGFRAALGSERPSDADVVVLDAIGSLREAYAEGDVAVVGGSFSRPGGHTPLEAAARGCAVLVGPNPGSYRRVAGELCAAGGAVSVASGGLAAAIADLLRDDARRRDRGTRARAFVSSGRGAARRCANEIAAAVEERRARRGVSGSETPAASPPRDSAGRGR